MKQNFVSHGLQPKKYDNSGKLPLVFDCAASYWGISINSALMQCPDLVNNLVGTSGVGKKIGGGQTVRF